VTPFLDSRPRGIFATRFPARSNPIGVLVVGLVGVEEGTLEVEGVDMVDGTPVLDIKSYVPAFDHWPGALTGWFQGNERRAFRVQPPGGDGPPRRSRLRSG